MDAYQTGTLDTQETLAIDTLFNISHAIEVIDHFNLNDSENLYEIYQPVIDIADAIKTIDTFSFDEEPLLKVFQPVLDVANVISTVNEHHQESE